MQTRTVWSILTGVTEQNYRNIGNDMRGRVHVVADKELAKGTTTSGYTRGD